MSAGASNTKKQTEELQLKKLALEIAALQAENETSREQRLREFAKLDQDILEKRLSNCARRKADGLAFQKAQLEVQEKTIAIKNATKANRLELAKWVVTVGTLAIAAGTFYWTYRKDNRAYWHQVELEQRFKIDAQVLKLLEGLGSKDPIVVLHSGMALPAYGVPAIGLLVPHFNLLHPNEVYDSFARGFAEIIKLEKTQQERENAARDIAQRFVSQMTAVVDEFKATKGSDPRYVNAHLRGLVQMSNNCAPVCDVVLLAFGKHASAIKAAVTKLENAEGVDQQLLGLVKNKIE